MWVGFGFHCGNALIARGDEGERIINKSAGAIGGELRLLSFAPSVCHIITEHRPRSRATLGAWHGIGQTPLLDWLVARVVMGFAFALPILRFRPKTPPPIG